MEARPAYGSSRKGPHNLTVALAAWLRKMGFTVLEQSGVEPTALEASWRAPDGHASNQELVQAVRETRAAVWALPNRIMAVMDWNQSDTLALEQELNDVADDRNKVAIW
jgi:hypothetical protein